MNRLNCIIIEDQIPAQAILKRYLAQVPALNLVNTYISPLEALNELEIGSIDVLFLDIDLPKISGIELIKLLQNPPRIILTTAFSEYAIEGFELDVVDYLLKPFSFERFLKSITKVQHLLIEKSTVVQDQYLFVRNNLSIKKIVITDIKYIEAKGDFVIIRTGNNREIANISMQDILPKIGTQFIRCHKSYSINLEAIEKIMGNQITINHKQIPIGRTYKKDLLSKLKMI